MIKTTFNKDVLLGKIDGQKTFLACPSWDCDWYWGFGYIQNRDLHTHVNSLDKNKNMFDAMQEFFGDSLTLSDDKLWTFCELMQTFYSLKQIASFYHSGSSGFTLNPLGEELKDEKEYNRINQELLPKIFDEVYKLFN